MANSKKFEVKKYNENFGKGHPGYNISLYIHQDEKCLGRISGPNVNGVDYDGIGSILSFNRMAEIDFEKVVTAEEFDKIFEPLIVARNSDETEVKWLIELGLVKSAKVLAEKIKERDDKKRKKEEEQKKKEEKNLESYKNWRSGEEMLVYLVGNKNSFYYAPHTTHRDGESFGSSNTFKVKIVGNPEKDCYDFYLNEVPVRVYFGKKFDIDVIANAHWANKQNWKFGEINPESLLLKGILEVNGNDPGFTAEETSKIKNEKEKKEKEAKQERKAYYEQILADAVSAGINKKTAQAIVRKNNVATLKGVVELKKKEVNQKDATKVAKKAEAWSYMHDVIGMSEEVCRPFWNAKNACREYAKLPKIENKLEGKLLPDGSRCWSF